ncbi:MAG: hypothetical protein PHC66_04490, partial [Candidatus Nanoarchaeia archaeon]|nr:hypothetical protein [Candidatus Nanoarchaeia archaeon]
GSSWEAMPTSTVEKEGSEYTYSATTSSFSFFAITAPDAPPRITPNVSAGESYATENNGTTVTSEIVNLSCGDGVCGENETCLTCQADCGNCTFFGSNTISKTISFVKAYWIPLTIAVVIIGVAVTFFLFSGGKEGLMSVITSLIPKPVARAKPAEEKSSKSAAAQKKAFELEKARQTKQTTLKESKKEKTSESQTPDKKIFGLFGGGKKKEVIEGLKKEPGVFKLK